MPDNERADDLSPEQQVVAAILARDHGWDTALVLVRDARFEAYAAGSYLAPVLTEMAAKLTEIVEQYQQIVEADGGA